jgi:hypothetical protein
VFVIGGGVADAGKLLRDPVELAYIERLTGRGNARPPGCCSRHFAATRASSGPRTWPDTLTEASRPGSAWRKMPRRRGLRMRRRPPRAVLGRFVVVNELLEHGT